MKYFDSQFYVILFLYIILCYEDKNEDDEDYNENNEQFLYYEYQAIKNY